jgi:hypothetical protein
VNGTDSLTRTHRPETPGSAREWQRIKNANEAAGLCPADAAAIAWAHTLGFTRVPRTPCDVCAPIVATFPEETAHSSWRTHKRGRTGAPSTRSGASRGVSGSADLATASTGELNDQQTKTSDPAAATSTLTGRRVFGVVSTPVHALAEVTP